MFTASWIWSDHDPLTYNQSLLARRDFTIAEWKAGDSAVIRITADSWYRLFLNGQWVADGPARSWPEHYQYDEIDAAPYLTAGRNELRVIVRYWGVGNFHTLPQQAGLLAQLDVTPSSGESLRIMTDSTWQVAHLPAWLVNTPKVSIQMEPQEIYDARLGDPKVTLTGEVGLQDNLEFKPAKILYAAGEGPWTDLNVRDVAMLSREPVMPVGLPSVVCVPRIERILSFTFPAARLAHPDLVEANGNTTMPGGLITQLELDQETEINFTAQGVRIYVDGKDSTGDRRRLSAGNHIVLVFVSEAVGHNKEKSFWLEFDSDGMHWVNLLDKTAQNPWLYLAFPEFAFSRDDQHWSINRPEPQISALLNGYAAEIDRLAALVTSPETFQSHLSARARQFTLAELFLLDTHWRFLKRQVLEKVDLQDEMEWSKGEGQIIL